MSMNSNRTFKTAIATTVVAGIVAFGAQRGVAALCDVVADFPSVMQVDWHVPGNFGLVPSYVDLDLWASGEYPDPAKMIGKFDGWCVETGVNLGLDGFEVIPVCLYSAAAAGAVPFPENLPALNWLLDKVMKGQLIGSPSPAGCGGTPYTPDDVQAAVWLLVENKMVPTVEPSICKAQALADLAIASGANFTPNCDDNDYVGILLLSASRQNTIIMVPAPCDEGGCTLTPGYWKTHSEYGPAPYDETWAELEDGADTPFFLSGQTYYQALWTSPNGNAYYILAHAYIAAELNSLNGASSTPDVTDAFDLATGLLGSYTPAQIAALKGSSPVRQQFIALAAILDAYNNGLIGPGHCGDGTIAATEQGGIADPALLPLRSGLQNSSAW